MRRQTERKMRTITSLLNPVSIAYEWHTSPFDIRGQASNPLCHNLAMYSTYGDGTVKHSNEWHVPASMAIDALASLSVAMLDDIASEDWNPLLDWLMFTGDSQIRFALSVKYNESKPQWYSLGQQKVSSSKSKANDRRYEPVPEWADGTAKSAYRLIVRPHYDYIEKLILAQRISEMVEAGGGYAGSLSKIVEFPQLENMEPAFSALSGFDQVWQQLWHAIKAAQSIKAAKRLDGFTRRDFEAYLSEKKP